jgi:hypothetical protein
MALLASNAGRTKEKGIHHKGTESTEEIQRKPESQKAGRPEAGIRKQ